MKQNCTSYVTHTDLTQDSVDIFLEKIPNVSPHDCGRSEVILKHLGYLLQPLIRVYHTSDVTFQFVQENKNKKKKKKQNPQLNIKRKRLIYAWLRHMYLLKWFAYNVYLRFMRNQFHEEWIPPPEVMCMPYVKARVAENIEQNATPTQNMQQNRPIANQNAKNICTRKNNTTQNPFENNSNNLQNNT